MARGDRCDVGSIVAVVPAVRDLQDLGKDIRVVAAAIEVVLPGAEVREHRRHAAGNGGAALGDGILGERAIDADVGVGIDDTGKRELTATIVAAPDLRRGNLRRHARDAAMPHADVGALDARRGGAHDANVLDDEVEDFGHLARIAPFTEGAVKASTEGAVKTRASLTRPVRPDSVGALQISNSTRGWTMDFTAAAVAQAVRDKRISPVELVRECLTRIERRNPALRAFITVDAEGALAAARRLEAEAARGRLRRPPPRVAGAPQGPPRAPRPP